MPPLCAVCVFAIRKKTRESGSGTRHKFPVGFNFSRGRFYAFRALAAGEREKFSEERRAEKNREIPGWGVETAPRRIPPSPRVFQFQFSGKSLRNERRVTSFENWESGTYIAGVQCIATRRGKSSRKRVNGRWPREKGERGGRCLQMKTSRLSRPGTRDTWRRKTPASSSSTSTRQQKGRTRTRARDVHGACKFALKLT